MHARTYTSSCTARLARVCLRVSGAPMAWRVTVCRPDGGLDIHDGELSGVWTSRQLRRRRGAIALAAHIRNLFFALGYRDDYFLVEVYEE